jgi:hypothetical protein
VALFAAAGLFVGGVAMPSAKAADLGGDCCADLEERVAELEATTARKGNRRMSLTVTGQVNRLVTWWDDGLRDGTYYGLDSTNSSSRFTFLGEAKVTGAVKMGFEITIEIEAGGTSSKVNAFDEDGKVGAQIGGPASFNASNVDAYFGDARRAAWWIEHKDIGRLTVGRYESAGVVTTIDLGGIAVIASSSVVLLNGGFNVTDVFGQTGTLTWGNLGDPASAQGRTELIRYDSPTIAGFIASASIAEAGNYWGVMLRYAGEFSGVRVAAGIGYEDITDRATPNADVGPLTVPDQDDPGLTAWGASLAVMHVPTGLFLQGHYMAVNYDAGTTGYWGQSIANKKDAHQWMIQGGITKNWFGIGNTALYAEYINSDGWGAGSGVGRSYAANAVAGLVASPNVTDTETRIWGLGIVQNVDAAATEFYLGYRNFEITRFVTGGVDVSDNLNEFHQVTGGARVKF